jgi:tRNA threonylcarbamoyladenosine biosynthesis protein TsaE
LIHQSHSVADTEAIAADLSRTLRGGEVVALYGDLGAGKTQFVRGLVRGLGGNPHTVSSPTFVLLNVYDSGRLVVFHLDAYRIHGPEEFESIGFTELLDQAGIVVVEWAERVEALLPAQRINVRIATTDREARRIELDNASGN